MNYVLSRRFFFSRSIERIFSSLRLRLILDSHRFFCIGNFSLSHDATRSWLENSLWRREYTSKGYAIAVQASWRFSFFALRGNGKFLSVCTITIHGASIKCYEAMNKRPALNIKFLHYFCHIARLCWHCVFHSFCDKDVQAITIGNCRHRNPKKKKKTE